MKRIAVAIIHGIEIEDPDFAATPTRLLRDEFGRILGDDGPDPEDALVVEPIHWAPIFAERQRQLFERMYGPDVARAFDEHLSELVRDLNSGRTRSLPRLMASILQPTAAGATALHYPTGRWIMMHFVGDIAGYDRSAAPDNYTAIHETLAQGLAALARRAGEDVPLCVVAHSLGTILASDYFYDQQQKAANVKDLVPVAVNDAMGPSPLAKGETLAWMYTMGSPLAIWSLRYPDATLGRPIDFPAPKLSAHHPGLGGEWVNIYDKDDVAAYPLRPLSEGYHDVVTEDRAVAVKGPLVSWTPLVHPFYWSDRAVIRPIATTLAEAWRQINE